MSHAGNEIGTYMGHPSNFFHMTGEGKRILGRGGNPNDSHYASNLRADITRDQWADYKQRFQPLEQRLTGIANNSGQFVNDANQRALGAINQSFGQAPDQINREYGKLGMSYTPDQQNEVNRRLQLNQGLSQVQGLNMSTRTANDQVFGLIGGGGFQDQRSLINQQQGR